MVVLDSRTFFGWMIRTPLRFISPAAVIPVLSGPMVGMRWVAGSMPHGAWIGTLERRQLSHFVKRLRPGMTVWDIGANVGLYTLPSARAVGLTGRVYAFEPMRRNLQYLNRHIALNKVGNIIVCDVAVADISGTLLMAEGDSPSEFHADAKGTLEVSSIALDEWRNESGSPPPNMVKIDVEGAETAVLRGGAGTFSTCRPPI
jgi:FkbM family methyltransferase